MTERSDLDLGQQSGSEFGEASESHTTSAEQIAQAATSTTDSAAQPDDQPVVKSELNETVIVDEDDLPNATGEQDSPGDLNPQFTTGTLEGSVGNDGPATFTLLDTGSPDGYTYKVVGDVLTVSDGSKPVLEVSLKDPATGEYRVDLLDKIDQQAGPQPKFETNKDFTISYRVTDADGDYADGKFVIRVNDDIPVSEEFTTEQLTVEQPTEIDRTQVTQTVQASQTTPIILPEGAQIVAILANGSDLFIRLSDGSLIQVIDGLKTIPTIVTGAGEITSETLTAALQANGVVLPAAGEEGPDSSGGAFGAAGEFNISAFDENPLLPPTAFDREFGGFIETGGFIENEPLVPPQILNIDGGPLRVEDPALPDGTTPLDDGETYTATVEIQAGSGTVNQLFFLPDLSGIQVDGIAPGVNIIWTFIDPQTIHGTIEGDSGPTIILTLQPLTPINPGETGDGFLVVELVKAFPHAPGTDEATVTGVPVGIEDSQGQTAQAVTGFDVFDDQPEVEIQPDNTTGDPADMFDSVAEDGSNLTGTITLVEGADQDATLEISGPELGSSLNFTLDGTLQNDSTTVTDSVTGDVLGTLSVTINANGTASWEFNPSPDVDQLSGDPAFTFTATITDADNDQATDSHTVIITDGAGPTGGDSMSLTLDEDDLPDGSDTTGPLTTSDTLTFTAGSDAITSIVFSTDLSGLTDDGDLVTGAGTITWDRVSDTQITGTVNGQIAVTLDLVAPATIAAGATDATTQVTMTLSQEFQNEFGDDLPTSLDLGSVQVIASEDDATDFATGTVNLTVIDDVPVATDVTATPVLDDDEQNAFGNDTPDDGVPNATSIPRTAAGTLFSPGADGVSAIVITAAAMMAIYVDPVTAAATQYAVDWGTGAVDNGDGSWTLTGTAPAIGTVAVLTVYEDGSYEYTQSAPVRNAAGTSDGVEETTDFVFGVTVTDGDGDSDSADLTIQINDDTPTLGPIQDGLADSDPSAAPTTGSLNFAAGADGFGQVTEITMDTTGVKSGGYTIVQQQTGNVLTGYADVDGSGDVSAGDTEVFTLTIDPNTGPSGGTYTFDLIAPLDGLTTDVTIGQGSAFGSGPSDSIVVTDPEVPGINIVYATGWVPSPLGSEVFTVTEEADWLAGNSPDLIKVANLNGSTQGWGLGNNNFNVGEFIRFDFGTLDDYDDAGPYTPPAGLTIANAEYVVFSFFNFDTGDVVEFVAHYTDGTTESFVINDATVSTFRIDAPAGTNIAWVDAYQSSGVIKLNLTNVGVKSTTVDIDIPVTVTLTDGDGDEASDSFTINVADDNTPSVATPVILDLDGDGIETINLSDSSVMYDYDGDGTAAATAWVGADDGILAVDLNDDGMVSDASEFVFTEHAPGAATDLAALAAVFDTNGDGKFTAEDDQFAKFGVWQDADGDGVSDAGEFKLLSELGIVEIGLESDGNLVVSSDGSVISYGEATFVYADGTTGTAADIGFAHLDTGTSLDDILIGDVNANTLNGGGGDDTFVLSLDSTDTIEDYVLGDGDEIDLTGLFDVAGGDVNQYVRIDDVDSDGDGELYVDADGAGPGTEVHVAILTGVTTGVTVLYDDSNEVSGTDTATIV